MWWQSCTSHDKDSQGARELCIDSHISPPQSYTLSQCPQVSPRARHLITVDVLVRIRLDKTLKICHVPLSTGVGGVCRETSGMYVTERATELLVHSHNIRMVLVSNILTYIAHLQKHV